jgi:hypothetical protein
MSEIRKKIREFLGDRGAIFLEWLENAFAKIANLQFQELEADEIAFFLACAAIVALAVLKLARELSAAKGT